MIDLETQDIISKNMNEFDDNNGKVTIEFSIKNNKVNEYFELLNTKHSNIGNWFAYKCDTCEKQHGKDYIHVELIPDCEDRYIKEISCLVCKTNYNRNTK